MDINRSSLISNSLFINSLTEVMVRFQESKVQFNPFQATGSVQSAGYYFDILCNTTI